MEDTPPEYLDSRVTRCLRLLRGQMNNLDMREQIQMLSSHMFWMGRYALHSSLSKTDFSGSDSFGYGLRSTQMGRVWSGHRQRLMILN
jgi:hypothetical protein